MVASPTRVEEVEKEFPGETLQSRDVMTWLKAPCTLPDSLLGERIYAISHVVTWVPKPT